MDGEVSQHGGQRPYGRVAGWLSLAVIVGTLAVSTQGRADDFETPGVLAQLLGAKRPGTSAERKDADRARILSLQNSKRAGAALELAEMLRDKNLPAELQLEAVAGLWRHADVPAATKTLLWRFTKVVDSGDEGALAEQRVRATAALALASQGSQAGLHLLAAKANNSGELDPAGREMAREALRAHAPGLLAPKKPQASESDSASGCQQLNTPDKVDWNGEGGWHAVQRLSYCPLPTPFTHHDAWKTSLKNTTPWPLRALTVIVARGKGGRSLHKLLVTHARSALLSDDKLRRSAGAWALAVAQPEKVEPLLASKHEEVVLTVLNQSHNRSLAVLPSVLEANKARGLPPAHEASWDAFSTLRLRQGTVAAFEADRHPWLAALSSRLQPASRSRQTGLGISDHQVGLNPTAKELQDLWDQAKSDERASIAQGLGWTRGDGRSRARGVLRHLYRRENEAKVRRIVCVALWRQGEGAGTRFGATVAALDPDAGCRALMNATHDAPVGTPVVVSKTGRSKARVARVWMPPLSLLVAPDGFAGAVTREPLGNFECPGASLAFGPCDSSRLPPR